MDIHFQLSSFCIKFLYLIELDTPEHVAPSTGSSLMHCHYGGLIVALKRRKDLKKGIFIIDDFLLIGVKSKADKVGVIVFMSCTKNIKSTIQFKIKFYFIWDSPGIGMGYVPSEVGTVGGVVSQVSSAGMST